MNEQPLKVLLATPSYDGRFDVRYLDSLTQTIELCNQNNIKILPYYLCYDSLIQRARNDYFKVFYNNKQLDILFFIDSDMGWNPQDFLKLVLSDKDMIGATYRKKTDDEELYAFKALGEDTKTFEITPDENGLLEIAGIGCGFLKISRRCADMLFESEPNFYRGDKNDVDSITKNICECTINANNHFVSEDIIMGYKWRQLGGKVYLDTNIQCWHVGNKSYTGNVQQWLKNWRIAFENTPKESPSSLITKYFTLDTPQEDSSEQVNQFPAINLVGTTDTSQQVGVSGTIGSNNQEELVEIFKVL